jgi:hypothetical protein
MPEERYIGNNLVEIDHGLMEVLSLYFHGGADVNNRNSG